MPGHTVSDLYALRHLTRASGGLPESHRGSDLDWLRPVAWKVLLGFIPVEKKEWGRTLAKRREEYYVSGKREMCKGISLSLFPFSIMFSIIWIFIQNLFPLIISRWNLEPLL